MLSRLQKLSKDLIIYSVLLSDFEKLDFKNDALAGVRANYFNSSCSSQKEKTDIMLDERMFSLSYSMEKGSALSWKVSYNHRPFQTVKRISDDVYCVIAYGDNGIVNKRLYFNNEHQWLRTEYYDKNLENRLLAQLTPGMYDGLLTLKYDSFPQTGKKNTSILFPQEEQPRKRCAGLVYSNAGMIWFDPAFKPQNTAQKKEAAVGSTGFCFHPGSFTQRSEHPLDLYHADYLNEEDTAFSTDNVDVHEPAENHPYSAYDKIEQILFEAQKTNKNIFGEIVNQTADEIFLTERTQQKEEITEEISGEQPESPEESDAKPREIFEYERVEQGAPDSEITAKGGVYSYYGQLDEENKRSGRGRVVSPDGITMYDGEYRSDKRDGFGVCYYKDGSPNYVGMWNMGSRSGSGIGFRHLDGTMHIGRWVDNTPEHVGARFDKEGNFIDVCTYSNGVRNGKSVSFDESGNVVIKIWKNGEIISERVISDEDEK